ncbi:MAG: mechanosensitive ion channel domain-containing protein [Thermoanaerobaculia bacterium]
MNRRNKLLMGGVLLLIAVVGPGVMIAAAQEEVVAEAPAAEAPEVPEAVETSGGAVTVGDPRISQDELHILLRPLTLQELEVEANAWQSLVEAKSKEISRAEIAGKRGEQIDGKAMASLLGEQASLITRLNLALSAWEKKGGDAAELKKYSSVVAGGGLEGAEAGVRGQFVRNWVISEEGGLGLLKNLGWFLLTVLLAWVLAKIAGRVVSKALSKTPNISNLLQDFLVRMIRGAVLVVGVIVALPRLGLEIGPLLAVVGAAGFAVAFALQGTLSNFASGIMILFYQPFDVGDFVEVAGISGKVESLTLVSTELNTVDNKKVLVPNNSVWQGIITNATGSPTRRVDLVFGIGYGDSIEKATAILEDIVAKHELVLESPEPVIKVHELGDSSVNFICRPWAKTDDYWTVYWDITRAVKERFDAEGVSIPFPQRDVHLYQEQSD